MTRVFCTSTRTPTDGSTVDSASTASTEWKKVPPAPPWASGTSMPITPSSNSRSMRARGILACSSISRTSGLISRAANSRTLSRNSASSSARRVSGAGLPAFSTARECYHSRVMSKGRLRLAYCVLAAVFAAPLALGVKAQDAAAQQPEPAQQPAPPPAAPAEQTRRPRSSAPTSTSSAWTSSSPTGRATPSTI